MRDWLDEKPASLISAATAFSTTHFIRPAQLGVLEHIGTLHFDKKGFKLGFSRRTGNRMGNERVDLL